MSCSTDHVASYEYRDAEGALLATKLRFDEPKRFIWEMADGTPGLVGITERDLPLYNIWRLTEAESKGIVVFVEGEKAADALTKLGVKAVCLPGGSSTRPTVQQLLPLAGFKVALWPDRDSQGQGLMRRIYQKLTNLVPEIRAIYPESLPAKADAFDWVQQGHDKTDVLREWKLNRTGVLVARELQLINLEGREPKDIRWLWNGYLPMGMFVMLEGSKGVGKSFLTMQVAAQVSRGDLDFPGNSGNVTGGGKVLVLAHEDPVDEVIVPRLTRMKAIMKHVTLIDGVLNTDTGDEEWVDLYDDLAAIEAELLKDDYALLIIDPINNYIDPSKDSNKDQHVRAVLSPLAKLADRTGICIIGIRHFKKDQSGDMINWGVGSVAYGAVARTVLAVAKDPWTGEEADSVLIPVATNIAAPPPMVSFSLAARGMTADFVWGGPLRYSKAEFVAAVKENAKRVKERVKGGFDRNSEGGVIYRHVDGTEEDFTGELNP